MSNDTITINVMIGDRVLVGNIISDDEMDVWLEGTVVEMNGEELEEKDVVVVDDNGERFTVKESEVVGRR